MKNAKLSNREAIENFAADHLFHKVIPLAEAELKKEPNPEISLRLAEAYLFSGKEEKVLEAIEPARQLPDANRIVQLLWDHLNSRKLLAKKLGTEDKIGAKLLREVENWGVEAPSFTGIDLTAVLIVKNEEKFLEQCLSSLKGLVQQIVIVDTGSTDRTLEIAKAHGAKIGHFEWNNDFSAARNAALALVETPWALWVDADEQVPQTSHSGFFEGLIRPQFCGFNTPIWNFVSNEQIADQFVHTPTRLFQMLPGAAFHGRIHETVTDSILVHGLPVINLQNAAIHHFGYTPELIQERNKLERNQALLEAELEANPKDSFQWFNLGNNLSLLGRTEEAEEALRKSLEFGKPTQAHRLTSQFTLLQVLGAQAKFHDVIELCESIEEEGTFDLVVDFERANSLLQLERYTEALEAIEACLEKEWAVSRTGDYSIYVYKRLVTYGQVLTKLERYAEAATALTEALNRAPKCGIAGLSLAQVYRLQGETDQAVEVYDQWSSAEEIGLLCRIESANLLAEVERFAEAATRFKDLWNSFPNETTLWANWVHCAEMSGDLPQILSAYEAYQAQGSLMDSECLVNWGRSLFAAGQTNEAVTCFSEAIKRDPNNANAYFNCGDVLYQLGQFSDAAHVYESGLRVKPNDPNGWFVLGNALAQMNILGGAEIAYRQAIVLDPELSAAHHNLSLVSEGAA